MAELTMRAFLDERSFNQISRDAAEDMNAAKNIIMVLGYTFAPWLRFAGVGPFVEFAIGQLIGRHAKKEIAFAMAAESERQEAGTVWLIGKSAGIVDGKRVATCSTAIGGLLPIGTKLCDDRGMGTMRIGRTKIPMPIWFRAILPPQPWRYKSEAEAMCGFRGDCPRARISRVLPKQDWRRMTSSTQGAVRAGR